MRVEFGGVKTGAIVIKYDLESGEDIEIISSTVVTSRTVFAHNLDDARDAERIVLDGVGIARNVVMINQDEYAVIEHNESELFYEKLKKLTKTVELNNEE